MQRNVEKRNTAKERLTSGELSPYDFCNTICHNLDSALFVNEPNLSNSEEDAPDGDRPNDPHVQNQTEQRYQEANGPQQVQEEAQHNQREPQQALLEVTNESQQSNSVCVVCIVNELEHKIFVFLPCGHSSCCEQCHLRVFTEGHDCPECRSNIDSTQVIYITR